MPQYIDDNFYQLVAEYFSKPIKNDYNGVVNLIFLVSSY